MTATKLRIILSLTLFLIIGGAIGGFHYARTFLTEYAVEVSHRKIDAEASNGNISALEKVKTELAANKDVIAKAAALKSNSEFPEFDIVEDVTRYANQNNLTIESFNFGESSSTAGSNAASAPNSTAPGTPNKPAANNAAAGSSTVSISVTLKSPANYTDVLQFIHDLNQSVPKLKVQGVSVAGSGNSKSNVNIQPLVIEMYTR